LVQADQDLEVFLVLSIILWLSILLGALAACAALYGRYNVLPAFFTGTAVCQLEAGGCQVLFRTKEASLLGPPNALLGIILYLFLAAGLFAGWPASILILAGTAGLAMSMYLGCYLVKNHLQCRICWLGHISNAIIWLTLCVKLVIPGGWLP